MSKFTLIAIGSTRTSTESIAFKVDTLAGKVAGKTDKVAIADAAKKHDKELTPSYTTHAGSHVYAFKKSISALLEKNDAKTIELCKAAGLIKEVVEAPAAE